MGETCSAAAGEPSSEEAENVLNDWRAGDAVAADLCVRRSGEPVGEEVKDVLHAHAARLVVVGVAAGSARASAGVAGCACGRESRTRLAAGSAVGLADRSVARGAAAADARADDVIENTTVEGTLRREQSGVPGRICRGRENSCLRGLHDDAIGSSEHRVARNTVADAAELGREVEALGLSGRNRHGGCQVYRNDRPVAGSAEHLTGVGVDDPVRSWGRLASGVANAALEPGIRPAALANEEHELWSTKVMGYSEESRTTHSRSVMRANAYAEHESTSEGSSEGGGRSFGGDSDYAITSESMNENLGSTAGRTHSWQEAVTEGESHAPMLIPIMGKELSHVQFRTLEEQVHQAMVTLFGQGQREYTARLVGMKAPVAMTTPRVESALVYPWRIEKYVEEQMKRLPFALRGSDALKLLQDREANFAERFAGLGGEGHEPVRSGRRVRHHL